MPHYFSDSLVLNGSWKHFIFSISGKAGVSGKILNACDQMTHPWAHLQEIMIEANWKL